MFNTHCVEFWEKERDRLWMDLLPKFIHCCCRDLDPVHDILVKRDCWLPVISGAPLISLPLIVNYEGWIFMRSANPWISVLLELATAGDRSLRRFSFAGPVTHKYATCRQEPRRWILFLFLLSIVSDLSLFSLSGRAMSSWRTEQRFVFSELTNGNAAKYTRRAADRYAQGKSARELHS